MTIDEDDSDIEDAGEDNIFTKMWSAGDDTPVEVSTYTSIYVYK